jgi:hypothetical protein
MESKDFAAQGRKLRFFVQSAQAHYQLGWLFF